jgi:hypothetical protein
MELSANMPSKLRISTEFLVSSFAASVIALWILCGGDWSILTDRTDIRWLVMGDRAFGLLGWLDYLRHPWSFPLSTSSHYLYPLPTNVALTDSVPLLTFIAKIFAADEFSVWHPYGYWLVVCFSLQAVFANLIAHQLLAGSFILRFAFTLIVTIAPPLFFRNGHLSLMAHWVLLAAFLIGTAGPRVAHVVNYLTWVVLTAVAALIHPYWPPMVLVIAASVYFNSARTSVSPRSLSYAGALVRFLGLVITALAGFWMLGILNQPKPVDEIHIYTSDILMYFNSYGWSRYVPALFKFRSGQYEGFSYLGAGVLFIFICFFVIQRIFNDSHYSFKQLINPGANIRGLAIGCLLLFIWSLGAKVRFLGKTMGYLDFIYEPLLPILGTFRSVGRFAWGAHYLIILLLFLWLSNLWSQGRRRLSISVAILAVTFQLAETMDKFGSFFVRDNQFKPLYTAEWLPLLQGKTSIDLIPPELSDTPCMTLQNQSREWLPLALLAVQQGLHFNSGARANPPEAPAKSYCESLEVRLKNGLFENSSVYVIPFWADKSWKAKITSSQRLNCHQLSGGYDVCL